MSHASPKNFELGGLRHRNALHPHPERVTSELFTSGVFFDPHDAVQVKYEMLRRVRVDGLSVTRAVKEHGYTRPTYYEAKKAVERDGIAGLLPAKRGPHSSHKLSKEVMAYVGELRSASPSLVARELVKATSKRFGIKVHPRSVERALDREKKG
ncbi:MAG: helix-turn-helix domain-containing protein [bacterium]|nr:helix-turn-helix domain-containing protein [bacterium]